MGKLLKKSLIYLLAVMMVMPTWLMASYMSAPKAKAAIGDIVYENFDGGTLPTTFIVSGSTINSSTSYYSSSPNALKFDSNGDSLEIGNLQSPNLLSFWQKRTSASSVDLSFKLDGYNGSSWENNIDKITNIPTTKTDPAANYSHSLKENFTKIRLTLIKDPAESESGYAVIDDLKISSVGIHSTYSLNSDKSIYEYGVSGQLISTQADAQKLEETVKPIEITLSANKIGDIGYNKVQIPALKINSEHLQLWAKDTFGNWYDINQVGWGPEGGFPISKDYNATTQVYPVADQVGSYTGQITLENKDKDNEGIIVQSAPITINVLAENSTYVLSQTGLAASYEKGVLADLTGKVSQSEINAVVEDAVKDLTPVKVTLKTDELGLNGYDRVRIKPTNISNTQLWAKDTFGNWYDINQVGWGPASGFPIPANYQATTDIYLLSDSAGNYVGDINLENTCDHKILSSLTLKTSIYLPDITVDGLSESNLQELISDGYLVDNLGAVSVWGNLKIRVFDNQGNANEILIPAGTVISSANHEAISAAELSAALQDIAKTSGFATGFSANAVLQWGISGKKIAFSNPISISIFVGKALDGQTLAIRRSTSGTGDWETEGLQTTTCKVSEGYCKFSTTEASYFAALSLNISLDFSVISKIDNGNKTITVSWKGIDAVDAYSVYINGILVAQLNSVPGNKYFSINQNVSNYGFYTVSVVPAKEGVVSAEPKVKTIEIKPTVQKAVAKVDSSVKAPTVAKPILPQEETPEKKVATSKDDENGIIKGASDADEESTEETNWMPWIILFILIVLAGAVTGGYFYWFAGKDEIEQAEKDIKKIKKITKSDSKVTTTVRTRKKKSGNSKKPNRW